MTSFAFRVQAETATSGPELAVETTAARYEVRAMSAEAAATVARQLFRAELSRRRREPLSAVTVIEVLPAPRSGVVAVAPTSPP